jgi:hypothetical protein
MLSWHQQVRKNFSHLNTKKTFSEHYTDIVLMFVLLLLLLLLCLVRICRERHDFHSDWEPWPFRHSGHTFKRSLRCVGASGQYQQHRHIIMFRRPLHFSRAYMCALTHICARKMQCALRSRKPKLTTVGESLRWPRDTLYPLKLALTSSTSGGRSVGGYSSLADSTIGVYFIDVCSTGWYREMGWISGVGGGKEDTCWDRTIKILIRI